MSDHMELYHLSTLNSLLLGKEATWVEATWLEQQQRKCKQEFTATVIWLLDELSSPQTFFDRRWQYWMSGTLRGSQTISFDSQPICFYAVYWNSRASNHLTEIWREDFKLTVCRSWSSPLVASDSPFTSSYQLPIELKHASYYLPFLSYLAS